jgi:hypothetical protein
MKVDSVYTDIDFVDNRIKRTVVKTVTDEKTNKQYSEVEIYFEVYDKQGKIKTDKPNAVDVKV